MNNMNDTLIKGINVCNPVDVEKDYLLYTVEYAHNHGFDHIQINGPIHNPVKGNIDGMTFWRKYEQFNNEKDQDYVKLNLDAVNEACNKASEYGIKMYMWHHELELPVEFKNEYPQILNSYGDIEITHPLVRDFLENKIEDFFYAYPKMDGIVLTLHETRIPLLKLKDQKLDPVGRVKYVTQILFETCKKLGKELIVRPFASIEEDYEIMTKAYEEISENLIIMDKWTQFDWSLTAPSNRFFEKIKKNPLLIEADIYGEFFGKGFFPLMLKDHLKEKFAYCTGFEPTGYVFRIDRDNDHAFGDINEVNISITKAYLDGEDPDKAIDNFFLNRYPNAHNELKELMLQTEDVVIKTIYLNGYYFNSQSFFPALNHSRNHYYFEIMRDNYDIDTNEWFVPKNLNRGTIEGIFEEKACAVKKAEELLNKFEQLKGKIEDDDYKVIWNKFVNLKYATLIWQVLTHVFRSYVQYFETRDAKYIDEFENELNNLLIKRDEALEQLGNDFFCLRSPFMNSSAYLFDYIGQFADEIKRSFYKEKETTETIENESDVLDYVICAGAMEGHKLQKEVNFSDTLINDNGLCRIPGSSKGGEWCAVNAHGWFSYLVKVKPNSVNKIIVSAASLGKSLEMDVTIANQTHKVCEATSDLKELVFEFTENEGKDAVRIKFDKISSSIPCVYTIKVV